MLNREPIATLTAVTRGPAGLTFLAVTRLRRAPCGIPVG